MQATAVHDLYEASEANRRFLEARFLPSATAIEKYRRLVEVRCFRIPSASVRSGFGTQARRSRNIVVRLVMSPEALI